MDANGASSAKNLDLGPSESTVGKHDGSSDRAYLDQDEVFQREDVDDDDDLERQQSARRHFERDRDEGDDGGLTELAAPTPISRTRTRADSLEYEEGEARRRESYRRESYPRERRGADADDGNEFLTELASPAPVERRRAHHDEEKAEVSVPLTREPPDDQDIKNGALAKRFTRSRLATELYIHSYLIFFSILGTLARLGIESITSYPNATVTSPVLWANLSGSLFLGFLVEDRRLFREEWGTQSEDWSFHASKINSKDEDGEKIQQLRATHGKVKKTIPIFIGLSVGFCGSFTSFSSFILDAFLASLNKLPELSSGSAFGAIPTSDRNGGYNFEAIMAVLIVHVAVSLGALQVGANVAMALDQVLPTLPFKFVRRYLDPLMMFVGYGSWLGAVWLSIWPPANDWRGRVIFALVLAPPGCLLRFYASKHLNSLVPSFPLGTFSVNVFGTAILGMCYDLQHSGSAMNLAGCQVLEGVIDGFCGCATTVSTWVAELDTLQRKHGYIYGLASISLALGLLVVIMGSLEWTKGFAAPVC
jgi:CrcB protein